MVFRYFIMWKIRVNKEDISKALVFCGRMNPTNKWMKVAIEIALLAPYFSSEPPKGLDPTFYHTMSYEGDIERYKRLKELVRSIND